MLSSKVASTIDGTDSIYSKARQADLNEVLLVVIEEVADKPKPKIFMETLRKAGEVATP